jgi:hypothetical protein
VEAYLILLLLPVFAWTFGWLFGRWTDGRDRAVLIAWVLDVPASGLLALAVGQAVVMAAIWAAILGGIFCLAAGIGRRRHAPRVAA